jgi:4-hydroxy-tetrahydrodipicolinate reductase
VVAANFALGAVLMTHLAKIAARFFDHAEIIEMHHEGKVDSPSGTAISTARRMAEGREAPFQALPPQRETIEGARGGKADGVPIHSVRLPGLIAHQAVIFGGTGETLTIRHDSSSREAFMPGVVLAVREVMERQEVVFGLERLAGLE